MQPRKRIAFLVLVTALCLVTWTPAISSPPTTDLVEVMAVVDGVFPGPGGTVAQVEWGVRTHEDSPPLSVLLNAYIVFPNHLRKQAFPPEVVTLQPNDGLIKLGFMILPQQAGLGTATFHVEARVLWVQSGGGSGGLAIATDPFEVPLFFKGVAPKILPGQERNCAAQSGGRKRPDRINRHCSTGFDTLD